ncbi:MAG TPA: flagellar filament capping protein FliD [Burkholderiaceae bacterium]|jgi:flagellar hook-associated protein 2|nr:flagellar filament capping protein FliD [Burkholderiaceae bacterium]
MATISSPGIGSNLDVKSIVEGLMQIERKSLDTIKARKSDYQARLSGLGTLKSALASFQTVLGQVAQPSRFGGVKTSGFDNTLLSVDATAGAAAAQYALNVTKLAQPQVTVAAGQASISAPIGDGTPTRLTFSFGTITGGTLTDGEYSGASFSQDPTRTGGSIVIDSSNNSLAGIRDAINAAKLGVRASIVNDGSAGTPYRLVLTSAEPGAGGSVRIDVDAAVDGGTADAVLTGLLGHDPAGVQNLTQQSAAQNAELTINGIAVTSASNTVKGALDGVTLNLLKTGSTSLTVAADPNVAKQAVSDFVKAYNDLTRTLNALTVNDPKGTTIGPLASDASVTVLRSQMYRALSQTVGDGEVQSLADLGIRTQADGTLLLDDAKLTAKIASAPDDVMRLFAEVGKSTDSLVSASTIGAKTQAGTYAVNVTQLATQGKLAGTVPAPLTITAGDNDVFTIRVDGVSADITLPPGTYTNAGLVALLQSQINGAKALRSAGATVSVSMDAGGVLQLTSNRYGSASKVSVTEASANPLLGPAPVATDGIDMAGTINGEPATGNGQTLIGKSGSVIDGLIVTVPGGNLGDRGTVTITRGYAPTLKGMIDDLLSKEGMVASRTDAINNTIKGYDRDIANVEQRLTQREARYMAQFQALDSLISNMNATSSFLTQQLAALAKSTSNS